MKGQAEGELQRSSWRLALQTGALLVLFLVAIAGSVLLIVSTSQATAAQRLLTTATEHVDSIVDAPAGTWLAISSQGAMTVSPGMPSGLPDLKAMEAVAANGVAAEEDVSIAGRSYTVRTADSGGRVVQAVFDRHENLEELSRLGVALRGSSGVGEPPGRLVGPARHAAHGRGSGPAAAIRRRCKPRTAHPADVAQHACANAAATHGFFFAAGAAGGH